MEGAELARDHGPGPGERSIKAARKSGSFDVVFIEGTEEVLRTSVRGVRDSGYGSTSRMIAECAMALLAAPGVKPEFWTPAAALQDALLERLSAREVGISFSVELARSPIA